MNNTNTEYTVKGEYVSPSCSCISIQTEGQVLNASNTDASVSGIDNIGVNEYLDNIW